MAEALPTTTQASALSCLGQSGSGGGSPGREEGSEKQIGSPRCLLLSLLRSEALVTNKNGGGGPQGGGAVGGGIPETRERGGKAIHDNPGL